MDFGFQNGFLDFKVDFGFQNGFLDFKVDLLAARDGNKIISKL